MSLRALRRVVASPLTIVLAAAVLRLAYAWSYQAHVPHGALGAIPFLFEPGNIAHSIVSGEGFSSPLRIETGPTAWTTPVYPYLLALIMKIFGVYTFASWAAAVSLNICFSSLVCIPLFFAAKRIGGVALGAGSAWLWAVFPNAIQLTYGSLWDASLDALLGATLFWAALKLSESKRITAWLLFGALGGFVLMTDAALLSVFGLLLAWAAYRAWNHGTALRGATVAGGVAALCCVPWTIRNWEVLHTLEPLRDALGVQLWCGNNPDAHVVFRGQHHPISDQAERDEYVRLGEVAYMRERERDAVEYMLEHPAREEHLITGRFVSFWTGGTPTPISDFERTHSAWFRYVLLFNVALAFSALAGIIVLAARKSAYLFPAAAYVIVFPWAYYLSLSTPRYRHPIDPVVVLLAVVAALAAHRGFSTDR